MLKLLQMTSSQTHQQADQSQQKQQGVPAGRRGALFPVYEDLDGYCRHHVQRNREIEDLVQLLEMRVEAES